MNAFAIQAQWASASSGTWGEYDATLCNFRIEIGGENVTAYATDAGLHEDHLEIPAYYVAEWITENWWPLLWEPRKSEEAGDDYEFLTRHSLLTAEHGFALPSVQIVPGGERLQVSAHPRRAQHADAHFNRKSEAWIARKDAENALRKFVEETVLRLADKGHAATALEESWSLVRNTGPDEIEFCSLMGALGLSPYETHDNIESALDKASSMLSSEQMLDLCLTSTPENLVRSAYVAGHMNQAMQKVSQVDLATLQGFVPPSDDVGPAWRVGYKAAQALRENLSIGETDFNGASAVFERLGIDPTVRQVVDLAGVESPIVGGIEKHESAGRLALIQEGRQGRRFAAARGTYFLWAEKNKGRRLITDAVTRDQQISRAFAAELLVPQRYLRTQAKGNKLAREKVREIADLASVAPEMIKHQAVNSGLQLVG